MKIEDKTSNQILASLKNIGLDNLGPFRKRAMKPNQRRLKE